MDLFKGFIITCFTILIGVFLGTYIYKSSNINTKEVFNEDNKVYLLQVGVYSTEENMKKNTKNISDYFYFKDKDGFHVIIGIVENKNNFKKIGDSFGIMENIYLKEVKINNMEFLESLRQYEQLVNSTDDKNVIINAEKQVLSKYEEIILNSE
ncbi:MAG: hypothetical protein J6O56_02330 [Bacilli bacterium]|nr:hypothetical protein [Bacilli bacterium]